MGETNNTLETIAVEVGFSLYPLSSALARADGVEDLLKRLGFELPPGVSDIGLAGLSLKNLIEKLEMVLGSTSADRNNIALMSSRVTELMVEITGLVDRITAIANELPIRLAGFGEYVEKTHIDKELVPRLLDLMMVDYTMRRTPTLFASLQLVALFELRHFGADPTSFQPEHIRAIVHYNRIKILFSNPPDLFVAAYGWGTAGFDARLLLANFAMLLNTLGGIGEFRTLSRRVEEALLGRPVPEADSDPAAILFINLVKELGLASGAEVGLAIYDARASTSGSSDGGIGFMPIVRGTSDITFPLYREDLFLELDAGFDLGTGVNLVVRPNQTLLLQTGLFNGVGTTQGKLGIGLHYGSEQSESKTLLTLSEGLRLEIREVAVRGGVELRTGNEIDPYIETTLSGLKFYLNLTEGDGFLQKILPQDGIQIDFDLAIGWSNKKGLYFHGGAGLETTLSINKNLFDVLSINSIYLAIFAKESGISLAAAASVTLKLGPVTAAIQQMGLKAMLTFPEKGGNLGPINLEIGFKPPNGVGLVIDASVVVGAGFLEFDPDNQMYSGFIYLEIAKKISVTAVGLITTRMPDGSPGFSLLALISVQFSPGIQLGYGFTLNGLGGILGINRTVAVEVLRTGLRNGTLGSILFPADPKKNIARIISDLKAVFPPAEGRFVFGPMAILGWGPNELIKLELGLILELPDPVRLLILGRLSLKLPDEKNAVVRLKLDSLGVIDFSSGDVSLDAVLYDSEIKGFTITGEMALRANFGAAPGFLLSVGGFHPAFKAPPGFPALQRVAISLATGDNPRLRLAAYMAITTNTVQFGAALELYAKAGPFSLEGQLSFDALIQFDPFGLAIGLGAMVAIKWEEKVLLCLSLEMNLTGPTPWHAWGIIQFKILLFNVKISFDLTVGENQLLSPPMPVNLTKMVREALENPTNWSTQLPVGEHPLVVFREQTKQQDILVHPLAMLQVSQQVAPLDQELYKFGNAPLMDGVQKFNLIVLDVENPDLVVEDPDYVQDWFAPANFVEMSDDEKIAADSFEQQPAGVRFTHNGYICGSFIEEEDMNYETKTLVDDQVAASKGVAVQAVKNSAPYAITSKFLEQVASTGAVGQSLLQKTGNTKYQITAAKESVPTAFFELKSRSYAVVGGLVETDVDINGIPVVLPMMMNIGSFTAALEVLKVNQPIFFNPGERLKIIPFVERIFHE